MKFCDFSSDLRILASADAPNEPRVSVILPTYARAHGPLQEAIDSVLAQSFEDLELIIVDDGSRDGTADVLEEYLQKDSRIIVHSYHRNSGLPALRVNQAALHAKGKYIAYQFDDDLWPRESLEVRVHALDQQERPAVVYGNARLDIAMPDGSSQTRLLGGRFNFGLLMNGNYIANNTVIHHRELFDIAGMYDPHVMLRRHSDYDLWLRFAKHAEFIWVDEVVSHVRANMDGSLGKEIPLFFTRHRKSLALERNHLLRPQTINDYDVIDIGQFAHAFSEDEVNEYRRGEATPFLTKFNDYCSDAEMAVAASARHRRLHLLTVKPDYSTSIDVTIGNFVQLPHQRAITSTFVKESDLPAFDLNTVDVAVLYRTVTTLGNNLVDRKEDRVPSAYLMDDNMLHFHEVGPEHAFLAPGTPTYQRVAHQITNADACIGYSDAIIEDLHSLNSHSIRLNTNIGQRHVGQREYQRGSRLSVAVLTGPVRREVLRQLWPALSNFANKHPDEVEFHFWGIDPAEFEPLDCPVHFRPFTHVYESYLRNLGESAFDIVLVPLDFSTRAARSKSPVKLLEAVVAGAMCIFTDAPPYSSLPDDCCLRVANTTEAWEEALDRAYSIGIEGRTGYLERARALVQSSYTTEAQFYDFLAAFDAVRLHCSLGKKAIAYAFHEAALGGATLHLIRHAGLVASLGFRVVGIVPASAGYIDAFRERWNAATKGAVLFEERWPSGYVSGQMRQRPFEDQDKVAAARVAEMISKEDVGFLHFATWSPTMSLVASRLGIPCAASVHQYYEGAGSSAIRFADSIHCSSLTHGTRWAITAKSPVRRIVCPVDNAYFDTFASNRERAGNSTGPLRILVSGTLQPRKNQLAAIHAAVALTEAGHDIRMDLIGYVEFFKDYVAECKRVVAEHDLTDKIIFHGFISEPKPFYDQADLLLISATDESMPQTMLQAMSAGVPVVSTNVGGVSEIIKHRYSGFLTRDDSPQAMAEAVGQYISLSSEQRLEIVDRAQRAMRLLARPTYVRSELMDLYNQAFAQYRQHKESAHLQARQDSRLEAEPAPFSHELLLLETLERTRGQLQHLIRSEFGE
ncbi:glycosyltransferase [Metapseudomonas lalkuanensis]|uniref:glycosyltransferase n=1 Tax=Metapseudomonas lalkuanensis TaxID=2604832 RepID=UPI001CF15C55|nr:glycosyltransferase [Pseudomonas lalkuanensis]UCO97923.1 glycosyltransferase [Pseudomonas lalkuanensis]